MSTNQPNSENNGQSELITTVPSSNIQNIGAEEIIIYDDSGVSDLVSGENQFDYNTGCKFSSITTESVEANEIMDREKTELNEIVGYDDENLLTEDVTNDCPEEIGSANFPSTNDPEVCEEVAGTLNKMCDEIDENEVERVHSPRKKIKLINACAANGKCIDSPDECEYITCQSCNLVYHDKCFNYTDPLEKIICSICASAESLMNEN